MGEEWEPNIVCIACNWCTYQAADMAGSLRYSYPTTVKVVRVPCSGRVEAEFVLEALLNGADGVLIGGCHPGDCHYKTGNYYAERRYNLLKVFLKALGIEPERVRLEWISGSEGLKFAEVAREFHETIKKLGPINVKIDFDVMELARVITSAASVGKLLWDEPKCAVDLAKFVVDYVQSNSCGECVPCRIGTKRLQDLLRKLVEGRISNEELDLLKLLAEDIGYSSRCGLGRVAGKIVKYVLEFCKEDIDAHLNGGCARNIPPNSSWRAVVER